MTMVRKKINLTVEGTCDSCPFCRYDQNYSRSYDSGYDCTKKIRRIADDKDIGKYGDKINEYEESLKTMFPMEKPSITNPMDIPTWCPLDNV